MPSAQFEVGAHMSGRSIHVGIGAAVEGTTAP